jgi:hypothetical protein
MGNDEGDIFASPLEAKCARRFLVSRVSRHMIQTGRGEVGHAHTRYAVNAKAGIW